MLKLTKWGLAIGVLAGSGYLAYDYYRAGFHTLPDLPPGSFVMSYKNGLRAILIDVADERKSRRYFGFPRKVPFYLENTWSFCRPPNKVDERHILEILKARNWPGERLEVVCKIQVDAEEVPRGYITSVPKTE